MNAKRANQFFHDVNTEAGFQPYDDGNPGISIKILSGGLDTAARRGHRTRLLRLAPGAVTPAAHAHDYWEEIYILEGEMIVEDGTDGEKRVAAGSYAARQPGVMHGPVRSETGCLMIDFCWYDEESD